MKSSLKTLPTSKDCAPQKGEYNFKKESFLLNFSSLDLSLSLIRKAQSKRKFKKVSKPTDGFFSMLRKFLIYSLILSFTLDSHSMALNYYYMIKKNDNASTLLYRAKLRPIYAKSGTLFLLRKENAKHIPNIDLLFPGDRLFFPKTLALKAQHEGAVQITQRNEIIFNDRLKIKQKATNRTLANEPRDPNSPDTQSQKTAKEVQQKVKSLELINPETQAQSELEISLETGYSRLDSSLSSASAVLLSRPTLGANLKWQQNWSQSMSSFIRWNYNSISFQDTSSGTVIGGNKQTTSLMAVGLNHRLSQTLWGTLELGTREEIFAPSYVTGTATLETKPIPYARVLISKKLLEVNKLNLTGALGVSYLLGLSGTSYNVSPGAEYFTQLKVSHKFKRLSIFALGEYAETSQKTSLTNQTRKDFRTQFGLIIPLGKEE
ncbi:MAG: hypothetical protein B7Y39_01985 [Bdellovibrio sp. 28-41-41]|nr:MAG: hypothetical protein B7Y39_01985 [Bdellovibrio sp. 28-41-41]